MGDASFAQTSFLGGEWSKHAQGRFDRPDYRAAMNICLNGYPVEQGAWVRRPGSQFAGMTRAGQAARVLSFDFKQDTPYTLEFTSAFLRFRRGNRLVTTNDDQLVVSINTNNPCEVTIGGTHNWTTGNAVQFVNLGTFLAPLQNRVFNIVVTAANKFQLFDSVTGVGIPGSTLGTVPGSATVQRVLEVSTPYAGSLWSDVRLVQTETQAFLLHPTIEPQLLTATPAPISPTALPPAPGERLFTFTLERANLLDGPYLDPPTNGAALTPSGIQGIITISLAFSAYVAAKAYSKGDFVLFGGVNYRSVQDQNVGHQPDISPTFWTPVSAGLAIGPNGFVTTDIGRMIRLFNATSKWTWGKITSIANLIDPGLVNSFAFGNMSLNGGLAAAFDGNVNQASTACATTVGTDPVTGQVGKNYALVGGEKIAYGILWPSNDHGLVYATKTFTTTTQFFQRQVVGGFLQWVLLDTSNTTVTINTPINSVVVNMRGNMAAPASAADGTLLAQAINPPVGALTMTSNDQTTQWNFVWFEIVASGVDVGIPSTVDTRTDTAPVGSTAFLTFSVLNSFQTSIFAAEAQFANPPGTGASGNSIGVQILGDALFDTSTITSWQLGVYSNTTGWPSCGTYHEGRLVLAGSVPNRIDGSVSNNRFLFQPSLPSGQVVDSSAIAATFNSKNVNSIFWLESDQIGIIAGTQGGDWLVQATNNNNALTPTSIQAHPYSRLRCANIEPRRAEYGPLIVVPLFARKIYEHFPDVYSGKISAQNLTLNMQHLTKPVVKEIAYQRELTPIIWARMGDGSLVGITYKRESNVSSQPPSFAAGHLHFLGTGRIVESIAAGPSADGALDALTMVTLDIGTGIRHVEILAPLFEEGTPVADAWFLDDAVTPSSSQVIGDNFIINGLAHFEGKSPVVFAGGLDCGPFAVVNGSMTVPFGDGVSGGTGNGLFTADFVNSFNGAMPLVVGAIYTSRGQIVRPATPAESGARNGPALGKKRRAHLAAFLLDTTAAMEFGTRFDKLLPAIFRDDRGKPLLPSQTFSGVFRDTLKDDYDYDGMVCWQATRPYPVTVMAIEPFLSTQDA